MSKEKQQFQLGDTAYMIDDDYRFFKERVNEICLELNKWEYGYASTNCDFTKEDIGVWVFKTDEDRASYMKDKFINYNM